MPDMDEQNGGNGKKNPSGEVPPRATRRTFTRGSWASSPITCRQTPSSQSHGSEKNVLRPIWYKSRNG